MSPIVDTTDTVWRYPFPFLCVLLKTSMSVALIQAHHYAQQVSVWKTGHTRTCSSSYTGKPKDSWVHSYRPIAIIQQLSPRKSGRTHTSSSPLCKMSAKDSRPHSDSTIATRQQDSLAIAGRPDTDPRC
jgi:hypothetical protein